MRQQQGGFQFLQATLDRTISNETRGADPMVREKSAALSRAGSAKQKGIAEAPAAVARSQRLPTYRVVCTARIHVAPSLPLRFACRSNRAGNEPRPRRGLPPKPSRKP